MAEPGGPPSLFKLACDALCNSAKSGTLNLHFDPEKVSPALKECIWDQCSLMQIITLSSALNSTEFFAHIVRRKADDISVYSNTFNERLCALEITCVGKSMLMWHMMGASLSDDIGWNNFQLKIGEVRFLTQMTFGSTGVEAFNSYFLHNSVSEAVNWVLQLFQKDIE
ncbi:hypothetical protein CAEBREN_11892 [Caenorhabditis brenneri]|uniref:Uncharacterized protein n=1 Tax=Caenorhabditis brenneri TaxID=135651 RepID=G0MA99_CAEBE|nr:hypothetical protein CAEBREN_11892 [Caenorhabditis brenneri]